MDQAQAPSQITLASSPGVQSTTVGAGIIALETGCTVGLEQLRQAKAIETIIYQEKECRMPKCKSVRMFNGTKLALLQMRLDGRVHQNEAYRGLIHACRTHGMNALQVHANAPIGWDELRCPPSLQIHFEPRL